jgi:DNA-binding response OmpR family regulator
MARVVALAPDLFFASKVQETLSAAGHHVEVRTTPADALEAARIADVVIVDLNAGELDATLFRELAGRPLLGFYSHVDVEVKQRAEKAGFDLVVPRSRMAREMPELVDRLLNR